MTALAVPVESVFTVPLKPRLPPKVTGTPAIPTPLTSTTLIAKLTCAPGAGAAGTVDKLILLPVTEILSVLALSPIVIDRLMALFDLLAPVEIFPTTLPEESVTVVTGV